MYINQVTDSVNEIWQNHDWFWRFLSQFIPPSGYTVFGNFFHTHLAGRKLIKFQVELPYIRLYYSQTVGFPMCAPYLQACRWQRGQGLAPPNTHFSDSCQFFGVLNHSGMKYPKLIVYCIPVQSAGRFVFGLHSWYKSLYLDGNHIGSPGAVSIFRSL